MQGLPKLLEVALLIVLFLFLFGMAGYTIFYESGIVGENDNFKSFWESVYSLTILQTTSNFPGSYVFICIY